MEKIEEAELDMEIYRRRRRRSAMLLLFIYFAAIVAVFQTTEPWTVIDCLYFGVVTITTVGYGDLVPTTDFSKSMTIFFAVFGSTLGAVALRALTEDMVRIHSTMQLEIVRKTKQTWGKSGKDQPGDQDTASAMSVYAHRAYQCVFPQCFRAILAVNYAFLKCIFQLMVVIVIFGLVMGAIEGNLEGQFSPLNAIYFSSVTVTGVGYGDIHPVTQKGRLVAFLLIPFGVAFVAQTIIDFLMTTVRIHLKRKMLTKQGFASIDWNNDGHISELEFLQFALLEVGKCDVKFLREVKKQFDELDIDGSGTLDKQELEDGLQHVKADKPRKLVL